MFNYWELNEKKNQEFTGKSLNLIRLSSPVWVTRWWYVPNKQRLGTAGESQLMKHGYKCSYRMEWPFAITEFFVYPGPFSYWSLFPFMDYLP